MKKINRILLFHGPNICYNTLNIFSDLLAENFLNRGIGVSYIDYNSKKESLADQYVNAINKGFDAAIAINSYGYHETSMGNDYVFDYLNVPFYNWIVDHPNEHTDYLISNIKNYHVICIDRNHVKYVSQHYPNIKDVHFLPLGGEKSKDDFETSFEAFSKRTYDVTFCGSLGSIEKIDSLISKLPDDIRKLVHNVIDCMIADEKICYEDALTKVLDDNNLYFDNDDFLELSQIFGLANLYIHQYIRKKTISDLIEKGIKIDIFGEGWDALKYNNAKIHGAISYEETLKVAASSKIALNIMPIFKNGLHDRVSTSMMNGAAVSSDLSKYMEEIFFSGKKNKMLIEIEKYSNVSAVIEKALENLEDTYHIAMNGIDYANMHLSWNNRVNELIKIMEGCE